MFMCRHNTVCYVLFTAAFVQIIALVGNYICTFRNTTLKMADTGEDETSYIVNRLSHACEGNMTVATVLVV
jgi:hypothetical protein